MPHSHLFITIKHATKVQVVANFVAFVGCPKAKRLSASGSFASLTPSLPLDLVGDSAGHQAPVIGWRSRARHGHLNHSPTVWFLSFWL